MPSLISCPECGRKLNLPEEYLGKQVRCPSCKFQFLASAAPPPSDEILEVLPATEDSARQPPRRRTARRFDPDEPTRERTRKPAGRRIPIWPFVLIGLFLILAVGGVALFFAVASQRDRARSRRDAFAQAQFPPVVDEKWREDLMEALRKPDAAENERITQELLPLFSNLGEAFRTKNEAQIMACFDTDRLADELVAQQILPANEIKNRQAFQQGVRTGLGPGLKQNPFLEWNASEIRNVKLSPALGVEEAVVIVRHRNSEGMSLKLRWWVTKRDGTWRIYDFEDLDTAIRVTTNIGILSQNGLKGVGDSRRALAAITEALVLIKQQGDVDAAEKKLRSIARLQLPRQLEALRHFATAILHINRGQNEEALASIEKAASQHPDMPCLDFLRGVTYNQMQQWDNALKHLEAYQKLLGDDAELCCAIGNAQAGLGRYQEAAVNFRKSLDESPKDVDCFLGLLHAVRFGGKRDDIRARFTKLDNPRESFDHCAEDCLDNRDRKALDDLAEAMRGVDPNFAGADYYQALARVLSGKTDAARTLYESALKKEKDADKRQAYAAGFAQEMTKAGKGLDVYAMSPDAREAFRSIAPQMNVTFYKDDLRRLVAVHAKKHGDDPLLPMYQGELLVYQGRYPAADKAFDQGVKNIKDQEVLVPFRVSRLTARYHTSDAATAYKEIQQDSETFQLLARLCQTDEKYDQLEALVDLHTKSNPDDVSVVPYQIRLKAGQGKTDEAIALYKRALASQKPDLKRWDTYTFLRIMAETDHLLEAYQAMPNAKLAFQYLVDLSSGGEDDEPSFDLEPILALHRKRFPNDPWLAYYAAQKFMEEEAWGKAADAFSEAKLAGFGTSLLLPVNQPAPALPESPQDESVSEELKRQIQWNHVLTMYKAGRGLEGYRAASDRNAAFSQLTQLLIADKKLDELKRFIQVYELEAPRVTPLDGRGSQNPETTMAKARLAALSKQFDTAFTLFDQAQALQNLPHKRTLYENDLVADFNEVGAGLIVYRKLPDKSSIFRNLASRCVHDKKARELELLIKEHQADHGQDPWLKYYAGELSMLRDQYDDAVRAFSEVPEDSELGPYYQARSSLNRAYVKAGKAVAAYQEKGQSADAFRDLAFQCSHEKDIAQLLALIHAHRKNDPEDPNLLVWDLEVQWLKHDYESVLKLLTERQEDLQAVPTTRWKLGDYRVRSLIELKRADEALQAAETAYKKHSISLTPLAYAHAAMGNEKQLLTLFQKEKVGKYLIESFYDDPDLGPLLKGDGFKEFRAKYPERKDKKKE